MPSNEVIQMIRSLQEEDPVFCAHNYSAVHPESPEKIVDLSCVDTNRSCNSPIFRHFCNHAFFCGRKRTWAFGSRLLAVSSQPSMVFIKTSWRIPINPRGGGGTRDFKWRGWSNGAKSQDPKKSLGPPAKPQKIPGPKINPPKIPCLTRAM